MDCPFCKIPMTIRHNFPDGHSHICPKCGYYRLDMKPIADLVAKEMGRLIENDKPIHHRQPSLN